MPPKKNPHHGSSHSHSHSSHHSSKPGSRSHQRKSDHKSSHSTSQRHRSGYRDIDASDITQDSILQAIEHKRLDALRDSRDRGGNIHSKREIVEDKDLAGTPLHAAIFYHWQEGVEYLIRKRVDINAVTSDDKTPLHLAIELENTEIALYLLEQGADTSIKDSSGRTALHLAAARGLPVVVQHLIAGGADLNATISEDDTTTPLHLAIELEDTELATKIALCLLEKGADTTIKDSSGRTALHLAAARGLYVVVQCLIEGGADANATISVRKPITPLQQAIISKSWGIAELLMITMVHKGSPFTMKTEDKESFQQYAWEHELREVLDIFEELVECGCCSESLMRLQAVPCQGDNTHYFCHSCTKGWVVSNTIESKHEIKCCDTSGCTASLDRDWLLPALPKHLQTELTHLEQEASIHQAKIPNLEECPYCSYMAEYLLPFKALPVFQCRAPDCEKISCRRCKEKPHPKENCEEAKERRTHLQNPQHRIADAMNKAIIRSCKNPDCENKQLIKDDGCNKVKCTVQLTKGPRAGKQCNHKLCYDCGTDITPLGYDHFCSREHGTYLSVEECEGCHLFDIGTTVEVRHQAEREQAARKEIAKILADNPDADLGEYRKLLKRKQDGEANLEDDVNEEANQAARDQAYGMENLGLRDNAYDAYNQYPDPRYQDGYGPVHRPVHHFARDGGNQWHPDGERYLFVPERHVYPNDNNRFFDMPRDVRPRDHNHAPMGQLYRH
jgi:ankyrin repeat protein